ncbi:MAG TPA: hypothetical protein VIJ93_00720, partial [bacterium]
MKISIKYVLGLLAAGFLALPIGCGDNSSSAPSMPVTGSGGVIGKDWFFTTASASFSARDYQGSVVYNNKMWVIGGNDGAFKNDSWYSSDSVNWYQTPSSGASFSPRSSFGMVVYNGKMWVIGGNAGGTNKNDVYSSTDGVVWSTVTAAAAFSPRQLHTTVVFNNLMWVIGGLTNAGVTNDIWSSS